MLDLSHGFWVLLTILTLLRTSAAETRSLLWPALVGTLVGSVLAAALLAVDIPPTVFAVFLPLVMLVGFAAGPLLGLGWGQALFTVVIALVFAQVSPVDWNLAEAACSTSPSAPPSGLATGLLAWPRGGSGELHRAAGTYLAAAARVVRRDRRRPHPRCPRPAPRCPRPATPASSSRPRGRCTRPSTIRRRRSTGRPRCSPGTTPSAGPKGVSGSARPDGCCPAWSRSPSEADDVAARYDRVADALAAPRPVVLTAPPPDPPRGDWPTDLGADLYHLADLHVWLDGLRDDLCRIPAVPPQESSADQARPRRAASA